MKKLITGRHYWYQQKYEKIWRVCYIGEDPDNNQWLHAIGVSALPVSQMDLSMFFWKEIRQPKGFSNT